MRMIRTFADDETEALFNDEASRMLGTNLSRIARRKLVMLHAATNLMDLRSPPGNRLEKLKGNRAGQHSIRINDRYRVCFVWKSGDAYQVEVVDYH